MVEHEGKTSTGTPDIDHDLEFGTEKPSSDSTSIHPVDQRIDFPEGGLRPWSVVLGV